MSFPLTCQQCGRTVEIRRHPDGPTRRKNCSWRCRADAKRLGWAFIHQAKIEAEQGLALAGLLITPYTRREGGLTPPQAEAVADIQRRLAALRQLGKLPEGDICWVNPSPKKEPAPVIADQETWIRHKLNTRATFSLRVPAMEHA